MCGLKFCLSPVRGNALVNGLLGSDGTRDGNEIEALLQSYDI